jgi:hypothetical protein
MYLASLVKGGAMFFYGYHRKAIVRTPTGILRDLVDYEKGAINRGMTFIAFCTTTVEELGEWKYLVCGMDYSDLMAECNRLWRIKVGHLKRGRWTIMKLDRSEFTVTIYTGMRTKEVQETQLTFG